MSLTFKAKDIKQYARMQMILNVTSKKLHWVKITKGDKPNLTFTFEDAGKEWDEKTMPSKESLRSIAFQMIWTITTMYKANALVHGDIKPSNLRFTDMDNTKYAFNDDDQSIFTLPKGKRVILIDIEHSGFFCRRTEIMPDANLTLQFSATTRLKYPSAPPDHAEDIFSIGCTLLTMALHQSLQNDTNFIDAADNKYTALSIGPPYPKEITGTSQILKTYVLMDCVGVEFEPIYLNDVEMGIYINWRDSPTAVKARESIRTNLLKLYGENGLEFIKKLMSTSWYEDARTLLFHRYFLPFLSEISDTKDPKNAKLVEKEDASVDCVALETTFNQMTVL